MDCIECGSKLEITKDMIKCDTCNLIAANLGITEATEDRASSGHTEVALLSAEEIKRQERKRVWDEINKQIKPGDLQGNGCDETATRNGLIKATNIIFNLGI